MEKMPLEELTEEKKDAMLAEVGYTRRQLDSDVEHMKEWLKLQDHLPPSRLKEGDSFLKMYLTGCKGSLEKVKRKLDAYYTLRSHTELFDSRDPVDPDYVNIKYLTHFALISKLVNRKRITFFKLAEVDQEKFDMLSYFKSVLNMAEMSLRYERNYGVAFCFLIDAKGTTVRDHIMKIKPLQVKDLLYFAFQAMPNRYSNIFIINVPEYLAVAINTLIIPLLPKKMKSRLQITAKGFEEVSQYFDRSAVPSDYGGDLPPLRELSDVWRDREIELRDWFMNELSEKCDESKRIATEDPTNPYFGVPGSLKKLVVD